MSDHRNESEAITVDNPSSADTGDSKRELSTISFPYGDLDDAVAFAKEVHRIGGHSCGSEQLAGVLKVTPSGGAFRARMSHPRIFGLVEYDRNTISLTSLGRRMVDPAQEDSARVDAFLAVPLYKAIYEKYKGYTLPPPSALEREMASLGVSSKQVSRARQAFDRSARQAGFFWAGSERLTVPIIKQKPETKPVDQVDTTPTTDRTNVRVDSIIADLDGLDPLLIELLKKIPAVDQGWPEKQRVRWFRTFAMNVSQIYDDEVPVDLQIDLDTNK